MSNHVKDLDGVNTTQFSERKQRIYSFLAEQRTGVLSTVTPDNNPHGVVVYYALDDDFKISILTKKGTRKYENLIHNDHVTLTVFEPVNQATVQINGIATERNGRNEIDRVFTSIFHASEQSSQPDLPPIVKLQAGAFTTFQIVPVQIRMAVYARPDSGDYTELFESIESFEFRDTDSPKN